MNPNQKEHYRGRLDRALASLEASAVMEMTNVLAMSRITQARTWIVGNGGSATTADHFATDLLRCADRDGRPVRATSLCSNNGVITATANDLGYERIFTRQLEMLAKPGDVLVAISASGNSPTVVAAIKWAVDQMLTTVGLTGFDGGAARGLVDVSVHVESAVGDYGVIEDVHLVACHMVAEALRDDNRSQHSVEG